ncbi:hypothetical protein C7H09_03890 [Marinobacter fuscus]|uniref:Uncharacterized protein n=1 Tax=Marinobacter fuscus TaxID=2109942 RepID=A0A2T1KQD3_9GAMM|nr:hypothetical protein [Marinobacter fuscus]PSF12359.1 hypothetical protein C7H09_03890 [Marinobacter fuscus]
MKPLIRKSWYTLTETADYLARSTEGGPITVSDILQLAMEGTITLSVKVAETQGSIWPVGEVYPFRHLTQNEKEAMSKALKKDNALGAIPPALYFEDEVYGTVEHRYEPLAVGLWDFYLDEPAKELITRIWGYSKKEDAPNMERFRLPKGGAAWTKAFITLVDDTRLTVYRIPARHIFNGNYLAVKRSELSKLLVEPSNTTSRTPQQPKTSRAANEQQDPDRQHYPPQTGAEGITETAELRRTQRTLAALAIGLADKHGTYSHGNKPNIKALAEIATGHLRDANGRTPHGFSDRTARDAITAALKACPDLLNDSDKTG